jgi:hypothetical protein
MIDEKIEMKLAFLNILSALIEKKVRPLQFKSLKEKGMYKAIEDELLRLYPRCDDGGNAANPSENSFDKCNFCPLKQDS